MLLLQVWLTHLVAALSPGPDVLLTMRNSLAYGLRDGILTSVGIVSGVTIQIGLCLLGLVWTLEQWNVLFHGIALLGGAYLLYLGFGAMRTPLSRPSDTLSLVPSPVKNEPEMTGISEQCPPSFRPRLRPLREGLLTNLLNPKALLYFFAVFSSLLTREISFQERLLAGIGMIAIQLASFSFLAALVTHSSIRGRLFTVQHWLLRGMAMLFILLGLRIGFDHFRAIFETLQQSH
jgi:threonine/homoserine/homoserine lactone efflux protein